MGSGWINVSDYIWSHARLEVLFRNLAVDKVTNLNCRNQKIHSLDATWAHVGLDSRTSGCKLNLELMATAHGARCTKLYYLQESETLITRRANLSPSLDKEVVLIIVI